MKTWKHMSEDNRKTICSCISHNKKLIEISKIINYDPRAISKEVKRNRKPVDYADQTESKCPRLNRWPYVCTNCKNRYRKCSFVKFVYDSKVAQRKTDANLINSRKGIDLDSDEFDKLDSIIKKGTDENKSIYQIKIENKDSINKSISTLYRYINNGYSWSTFNSIPNYITTRQTISSKIQSINLNYIENVSKKETPNVIYIEADEVHANLQSRNKCTKNRIVPVILTHEGHKEDFVKKKELKEQHYIASSILKTDKLWNEAYKYLDTKYDLDKDPTIFISGDGGT